MGACSTHLSLTGETGVDALRLLFEVERVPEKPFEGDGWNGGGIPALGLCWIERKGGADGLMTPDDVLRHGTAGRALVDDTFTLRRSLRPNEVPGLSKGSAVTCGGGKALADRGVSRLDITTTRPFSNPARGRAFMAGMAAMEFPRLEAQRRGTPPHSVAWTGAKSRKIRNRVYDKSKEQGGEPWLKIRLEDQRSFPNGSRPPLELAADPSFQRQWFMQRFEPMRKAVAGVRAASFPVIAQALADEVRYGYRPALEAERLAGSLVILSGGGGEGYARATAYRRRADLREAGYVLVDGFMESVEVDLGDELEAALSEFGV